MSTIFKHRVEVEATVFNVPAEAPPGALAWGIDTFEGWKDTAEPTVLSTDFGANNDGVALNDWFPARQRFITLGGYAYASTEAQAEALADVLALTFPRNRMVAIARFEASPRYARIRRSSSIETDWSAVQTGFRWQVTLIAPDPLLYGLDALNGSAGVAGESSGGFTFPLTFPFVFTTGATTGETAVNLVNRGTAYSPSVRASIVGPLPQGSWKLRNDTTDQELSYDLGIGAGEELYIDMPNKTAYLNGFPVTVPPDGEFLTLAPGSNSIRLYGEFDPDAAVNIDAESAWE